MPTGSPRPPLDVLIADPDLTAAAGLAQIVRLFGHTARIAASARHVVQLAGEPFPDVVVLDVIFPGVDGYAVAECLRAFLPRRTLIAVVTARPGYEGWSRVEGIDHHFNKPLQVADLEDLLRLAESVSHPQG